jgi:hypothetical protein
MITTALILHVQTPDWKVCKMHGGDRILAEIVRGQTSVNCAGSLVFQATNGRAKTADPQLLTTC